MRRLVSIMRHGKRLCSSVVVEGVLSKKIFSINIVVRIGVSVYIEVYPKYFLSMVI